MNYFIVPDRSVAPPSTDCTSCGGKNYIWGEDGDSTQLTAGNKMGQFYFALCRLLMFSFGGDSNNQLVELYFTMICLELYSNLQAW